MVVQRNQHAGLTEVPMVTNANIITLLNAQLTLELSAIDQYFLHARMYRHWGLDKIAKKEYQESIEEMWHADKLINRILMLEGLPNLQALHKRMVGEDTPEMLDSDLKLELLSQKTLKDGHCRLRSGGGLRIPRSIAVHP
jgi:bacterioferritin